MLADEIGPELSKYVGSQHAMWQILVQTLAQRLDVLEQQPQSMTAAVVCNCSNQDEKIEQLEQKIQELATQLSKVSMSIEGTESVLPRLEKVELQETELLHQISDVTEQTRMNGVSQDDLQKLQQHMQEIAGFVEEKIHQKVDLTALIQLVDNIRKLITELLTESIVKIQVEKMAELKNLIMELATRLETHCALQEAASYVALLNEFEEKLASGVADLIKQLKLKANLDDVASLRELCTTKADMKELELKCSPEYVDTAVAGLQETISELVETDLVTKLNEKASLIEIETVRSDLEEVMEQMSELKATLDLTTATLEVREMEDQQLREELASCYPRKEDTMNQLNELQHQIEGSDNTNEMLALVDELRDNMNNLPTHEKVDDIVQRLDSKVDKSEFMAQKLLPVTGGGTVTTQCLACNQPVTQPEVDRPKAKTNSEFGATKVSILVKKFMNISSAKNKYQLRKKPSSERIMYGTVIDDRRARAPKVPVLLEQLRKTATVSEPSPELFIGKRGIPVAEIEDRVMKLTRKTPRRIPKPLENDNLILDGERVLNYGAKKKKQRPYSANMAIRATSKASSK